MQDPTTAILLALWQSSETTLQSLQSRTQLPAPQIQKSLTFLQSQNCQIEISPTTVRLAHVGLSCYQDILEFHAKTSHLAIATQTQIFRKTHSTNDLAWQAAQCNNPANHGLLIIADEQSHGRGRLGHHWSAKPNQSILLSILLLNFPANSLDQLTLLTGVLAARTLEQATLNLTNQHINIHLKWPNDLLLNQRKLAGILVERKNHSIVIGIGINIAQSPADFPAEISPRATSLYQATGLHLDRLRIIAPLITRLDQLPALIQASPESWLPEWKSRCNMLNSRITARSHNRPVTGQVIDIDPLHGLILRTDAGTTQFLSAATTTLS